MDYLIPDRFIGVAGAGACRHGFLWAADEIAQKDASHTERLRFYRLATNELRWLRRQLPRCRKAAPHPFYGNSYENELKAAVELVWRLRKEFGSRT